MARHLLPIVFLLSLVAQRYIADVLNATLGFGWTQLTASGGVGRVVCAGGTGRTGAAELRRRLGPDPCGRSGAVPGRTSEERSGPPPYRCACGPVGYATDRTVVLSATPSTPVGAVDGVGDRLLVLSATPPTPLGAIAGVDWRAARARREGERRGRAAGGRPGDGRPGGRALGRAGAPLRGGSRERERLLLLSRGG